MQVRANFIKIRGAFNKFQDGSF